MQKHTPTQYRTTVTRVTTNPDRKTGEPRMYKTTVVRTRVAAR